ncbi:MAG: hypothetical protein ACI8YC_000675 [Salibacteraceae bacterium]|jgi:hypothetical protein
MTSTLKVIVLIFLMSLFSCSKDEFKSEPETNFSPIPSPTPEKKEDFYTIVCPRMYNIDMQAANWIWTEREDYLPTFSNTENWDTVLSQTDCIKLMFHPLTQRYDNASRQKLANLIQETGREVLVELGGSRMEGGIKRNGDQAGEFAAKHDQKHLQKWLDTPGARLDAITTDHSMMWYVREMTPQQIDLLIQEHLDYIEAMQKWKPGLKVGFIESLGYFKFAEGGYHQTSAVLPFFEFTAFMTELMTEANKRGIVIDHFDIDFGLRGIVRDSYGANQFHRWNEIENLDYGRILKAEQVCRDLGLNVGVIFNELLSNPLYEAGKYATQEEADSDCALRNIEFIRGYLEAGGRPNRLVFQSWTMNPTRTGPESDSDSFLGITLRQLDEVSQFFGD